MFGATDVRGMHNMPQNVCWVGYIMKEDSTHCRVCTRYKLLLCVTYTAERGRWMYLPYIYVGWHV